MINACLVEEKTCCHQRADNQQYQDELKTITSQHGALQKKNGAETAPIYTIPD
jgi:hypothetical protein